MFKDSFWGVNGFEELRKYIKQGTELARDIGSILQERAELEVSYGKNLSKLGSRLSKATGISIGTLAESWCLVGTEMEAEAEVHRQFGQALIDDVCKVLKTIAEAESKARKPIEAAVEKATKSLSDRRVEESKSKKNAFVCVKDREKMYEQLNMVHEGKGKHTDKDAAKMDKKIKQLNELSFKSDKEYYESCRKAETAREEWETEIYKACDQLQHQEEEHISQLQDVLNRYNNHLAVIGPKLIKTCDKINEAVISVNVASDIRRIVDQKGTGPNQPEQILPDYYAEDRSNAMDAERRRQALQNYLLNIQQDLDREQKGKEGVEKLMDVYRNRPSFADNQTQDEAYMRLAHVNAMLRFFEATFFKVSSALSEFDGSPKPQSQFSSCIERSKDKQGQNVSTLKVPLSMIQNNCPVAVTNATYRAPADGGHVETYDDDEFDAAGPLCHCTAIYAYVGKEFDELTIAPGDVIAVYDKQPDGWWHGELKGKTGIFPATYVKNTL